MDKLARHHVLENCVTEQKKCFIFGILNLNLKSNKKNCFLAGTEFTHVAIHH